MKIASLTIRNFRCFGPTPTVIDLSESEVTAFIGSNASGKTAALHALMKLFASGPGRGHLDTDDFHFPTSATAEREPVSLLIEASITFPELSEEATTTSIAECFDQMIVAVEGGTPYCRARLEATWTPTGEPDGAIDERAYWVTTAADDPPETHK